MVGWLKDGELVAERKSIHVKMAREKKELEMQLKAKEKHVHYCQRDSSPKKENMDK